MRYGGDKSRETVSITGKRAPAHGFKMASYLARLKTDTMKKTIDLANLNRREHVEFFGQLDEPFHGLVFNLECTSAGG
jgi:hypothetical protein